MHSSNRLRSNRSGLSRVLASLAFFSVGAVACSSDPEAAAEPLDEERPLEGMPPAVTNMNPNGNGETDTGDDGENVTEGGPNVTGLDTDDGDGAAEQPANTCATNPELEGCATTVPMTPVVSLEVPAGDYCDAVADWDPEWVQFEEEVLLLVNEFRSEPADCGAEGQFAAAGPLSMDPILRCSSRLHSLDMFERAYFSHDNLDGVTPQARMAAAGFQGNRYGENIAQGQQTPEDVMEAWMGSDGHCSNIMLAGYTLIGIGYHPGAQMRGEPSDYWTQNFGTPRAAGGGGRNR